MPKKKTTVIEYRYDNSHAWTEYARTQVPAIVSLYYANCALENKGAKVRIRQL